MSSRPRRQTLVKIKRNFLSIISALFGVWKKVTALLSYWQRQKKKIIRLESDLSEVKKVSTEDKKRLAEIAEAKEERLKEVRALDQKMVAIQRSTRTAIPQFNKLHNYFRMRFGWYYRWHLNPYSSTVHSIILVVLISGAIFINVAPRLQRHVSAATVTWNGAGCPSNCNWNNASNWTGGVPGTTADVVINPARSDAIIINVPVDVNSVTINGSFAGTITQSTGQTINIRGATGWVQSVASFYGGDSAITNAGAFNLTGGTFVAGDGNMSITGTFTLSGANTFFRAKSGTTTHNGAFTNTGGGTFNPGTGTWTSQGGNTTYDVATTLTFYNFELNKNVGGTLTINTGDTLITNNITVTRGVINTGTFDSAGTVTIATAAGGGTGTILMNDANQVGQIVTGATACSVTLNNASASITADASSTFTLSTVEVDAGIIDLSAATSTTITGAVTITGGEFRAAAGTTTHSGTPFSHTTGSGGTFTHSNGTWAVTGSGTNYYTNDTFYDFVVNKNPGQPLVVNTGYSISVHNLTLSQGAINTGTINPSGTITIAGTATTTGTGQIVLDNPGQTANIPTGVTTCGFVVNNASASVTADPASTFTIGGPIEVDAGTFDLSNATSTTISVAITITGGELKAAAGTTTHLGHYYHYAGSGGTLNPSNGTWTVTGTGANYYTSDTFYDFNVNKTAGQVLNVQTGYSITVHNLTVTQGAISIGTINPSGTITIAGTESSGGNGQIVLDNPGQTANIPTGVTICGFQVNNPTASVTTDAGSTITIGTGLIEVDAGTFDISNATSATLTSDITITGGEFKAAAGTTTHAAAFNHFAGSGGTFTHSSGTWTVTGAGKNYYTNDTFYDLNVNKTAGQQHLLNTGYVMTVRNFTFTTGIVNTGTISVTGNVNITAGAGGGTGMLDFSGTGDQTYTDSGTEMTGAVSINKASGSVLPQTAMSFNTAGQDLAINTGTLDMNNQNLTINDQFTIGSSGILKLRGTETVSKAPTVTNFGGKVWYAATTSPVAIRNINYGNLTVWINGVDGGFTLPANLICGGIDIDNGTLTQSSTYTITVGATGIDISGGTFTGGSGTIDLNGPMNITGGAFTSTSGNLTFSGATWAHPSGTFTHGSGTVVFDGLNTTISGDTTFYKFSATRVDTVLNFAASSTQTIANTWTLTGVSGHLVRLQGSGTWNVNPQSTVSASYVYVNNSNNQGAAITAANSQDGGGNTGWTLTGPAGLSILGTCSINTRASACIDGETIRVAFNNSLQAQTGTTAGNASGTSTFTISGLTAPAAGTVITVYVESATAARLANAVTKYDGTDNITGVTLYEDHLTIGSDDNQTLSNADLSQYDHSVPSPTVAYVFFDVDASNNLNVDSTNHTTVETLYVLANNSYRPDSSGSARTITTVNLLDPGTIVQDANNITVTGTWTNNGTFTGGGGNLTIATLTITDGAFQAPSGTMTLSNAFTHTAGGTFSHNNGTVVFTGGNVTNNIANDTFYDVTQNRTADTNYLNGTAGNVITITHTLRLTNGYFHATGTINVTGSIVLDNTADSGVGVINLTGSGDQSFQVQSGVGLPGFNLNGNSATSISFAAGATVTVGGAVTVQSGTFNCGDAAITFTAALTISGGTFVASSGTTTINSTMTHTSGGTFTHHDGTVVFGGAGTPSVDVINDTFNNVTLNKTGDANYINANGAGDYMIISGTLRLTNGLFHGSGYHARGSIVVDNTADGGNTTIIVDGSGDQSFQIPTGATPPGFDLEGNSATHLTFDSGGTNTLSAAVSVASGTFDCGNAAVTFANSLTISGGTFIASSGTTTFNTTIIQSTGTFNHNSGLIVFAGTNATLDTANITFNNVTINRTAAGNYLNSTTGNIINFAGTLRITNGTFYAGGTYNLTGDLIYDAGADGGTAPLNFIGSATQNITVTAGGVTTTGAVVVNKTGGSVVLNSAVSFNAASQTVTITNGTLDLNGSNLTVNGALSVGATGTLKLRGTETVKTPTVTVGGITEFSATTSITLPAWGTGYNTATVRINGSGGTFALPANLSCYGLKIDLGTLNQSSTYTVTVGAGGLAMTGGAFNGSASAIDLNGNLSISGGVFTSTSGTMTISGNWSHPSGTFTHNSGTVTFDRAPTFDGASQTISGDTTFNNLRMVTADQIISFATGSTQTVAATWTVTGLAYRPVILQRSGSSGQWYVNPQSTTAVSYATVSWSNNLGGAITVTNSTDADNNTNWFPISIIGSCKQSDRTANCADGETVKVAVNGVLQGQTTTTLSGTFSISAVTQPLASDTVTVFIDSVSNALEANAVTVYDGAGQIRNVYLYEAHLTIGANDNATVTNADMMKYDNSVSANEDIFFDVDNTSHDLTVNSANVGSATTFYIDAGTTYRPDSSVARNITANKLVNAGTITLDGNTLYVSGDWTNSGSVSAGTSTVIFDGSSQTITGSTTFNDLTTTTQDQTLSFVAGSTQTIAGTWTVTGAASHLVTLQRSGGSGQWNVTPQGTVNVSYAHISDSNNTGTTICATYSSESGTNNGWTVAAGGSCGGNSDPVNDSLTFTNPYGGSGNTMVADDTTVWNLQAKVTDADGPTNLDYVEVHLANSADSTQPYDSLKFRWTEATDAFSETADTQTSATLTSTGADSSAVGNQWTLDFKIKLNNSFLAKDTNYAVEVYSLDDAAASDTDNYANTFQVTALSISIGVDSPTLAFGSLLPGNVITGSTTTTVTTNYPNGYTLSVYDAITGSNSALLHQGDLTTRIIDYASLISSPSAWSGTGLGICLYSATDKNTTQWGTGVSASDSNNKYAGVPETTTVINTVSGLISGSDNAYIGYKLVVPGTQKTGNYSGTVTYSVTGSLQ